MARRILMVACLLIGSSPLLALSAPAVAPLGCVLSLSFLPSPAGPGTTCFQDLDLDGFGSNVVITSVDLDCTDPGESSVNTDCHDSNPNIHPGATEIIGDGIDQNCDGMESCYQDLDNDGYGSQIVSTSADLDCLDAFESLVSTDCNDSNSSIHPAAIEIVGDSIDQDCNGGDLCYQDADNDNFGTTSTVTSLDVDCFDAFEAQVSGDCDDSNAAVFPGAVEIIGDGIDQNCSGGDTCYQDLDNDDFGTAVLIASADLDCFDPNEAPVSGDCDDTNANIFPGAFDIPGDGIDQDCSGANAAITFVRGDANADGTFDIGDPITILGFLFSSGSVSCLRALDGNDDEAVDIGDPVYILGTLFSSGPAPNAPFPGCGSDPTPGPLGCVSFPPCP